jgi:hypothetical protein
MSEIILTNEATPATPGSGKIVVFANSGGKLSQVNDAGVVAPLVGGGASYQATPADPTGTNNTTGLMMGLAGAITPATTGRIAISIYGDVQNTTTADGAKLGIYYGTGSAPANAAAITGTSVGSIQNFLAAANNQRVPFHLTVIVTGLVLGTAYWIDLMLGATVGGTAAAKNITVTAFEF